MWSKMGIINVTAFKGKKRDVENAKTLFIVSFINPSHSSPVP